MITAKHRLSTLFLIVLLFCAACRQGRLSSSDIQLDIKASDRRVGKTTLLVSVKDSQGKLIENPGTLSLRGDMDHAGMAPVFAEAEKAVDGLFTLPFEWTMAGGWMVEARLKLHSGDLVSRTFSYEILTEADADDMSGLEHSEMRGEASAVYMTISNRGSADRIIVSAESAAAERIEFHRTIIDNDIARMEGLTALVIPAGETLELRPGGTHIMLTGLAEDLLPESQISLQLAGSAGETYDLDVSIADMLMEELDDAVEYGDLVFSNRWARPARAGSMAHDDDMDMNEQG